MSMNPNDECRICHLPRERHTAGEIHHRFVGENDAGGLSHNDSPAESRDDDAGKPQGPNKVHLKSVGSDSVLRLALMRKGIILNEDLEAIEEELRVAGVAGYSPGEQP